MGWSIHLSSNKEITEQELEGIVNAFPPNLKGSWSNINIPIKNSLGGWNAATDISQPCGNSFSISGSYSMSGHVAEELSHYLKNEHEKTGHRISINSHIKRDFVRCVFLRRNKKKNGTPSKYLLDMSFFWNSKYLGKILYLSYVFSEFISTVFLFF